MESRKEKRQAKPKVASKERKTQKQVSIFTVLFVVLIIGAVIGLYFGIRALVITLKYKSYTDRMYTYGYNELYEDKKATSIHEVTNGEMLSVILGSLTNSKDVRSVYYLADKNLSDMDNWYNYSTHLGVNDIITKKELNSGASKIDASIIIVKMVEGYLNVEVEKAELKMNESELNKYSKEQQDIIAKAVTLGLIKNNTSAIKGRQILKGELNKLVINVVDEYATMHYNTDENVNIVTKKSEMPENYKEYPYIIDSIDNSIYELDYEVRTKSNFQTPKEVYKQLGDLYEQTDFRMTEYFDSLLNIDYETITVDSFLEDINDYSSYDIEKNIIEEYIEYVKSNKIKLQGSATPLLPIIYNNGENYQIRTKLTFKVLSSDTQYNLLFGDNNNKVKYNLKEITMYVDVPMGMTFNSRTLLIENVCLAQYLVKNTNNVIVEE